MEKETRVTLKVSVVLNFSSSRCRRVALLFANEEHKSLACDEIIPASEDIKRFTSSSK